MSRLLLILKLAALLLSCLSFNYVDGKTVTVTSYVTKYKIKTTKTYSASPATVVVYRSVTQTTKTSTVLNSSTSLPPPIAVSSVYSFVYDYTTVTSTSTSIASQTNSISSTYTVI